MASAIKAAKVQPGYEELKAITGSAPPAELNKLSADELNELTRLVSESLDLHAAAIAEAEERVVQLAPRPLRGTVRRVLGGGK